jgi:hypothetical protein
VTADSSKPNSKILSIFIVIYGSKPVLIIDLVVGLEQDYHLNFKGRNYTNKL